tara:strand:- start:45 stop:923 length:879 start_codon:yes stop_codon:yes gene_type:complete
MSLKLTPLRFVEKVKKVVVDSLVAGDNITLTTDSDNKVTIASAGGDDAVSNIWALPASGSASDEEFDTTTAFATGWTVTNSTDDSAGTISTGSVDFYTTFNSGDAIRINPNTSYRRSWALVQAPSRNKFYWITKLYTFPTNVLIYARLRFSSRVAAATNNDGNFGIVIGEMDGSTVDPIKYMALYLNESDTNTIQAQWSATNGAAGWSNLGNTVDIGEAGQPLEYVAIHKVGSTYYAWVGTESNWIYMGSSTLSNVSPDAVGFVVSNNNSDGKADVAGADFIRFIETDRFVL